MRHYGCCGVFLCSLDQAVNCQFRIQNTEMQQQPGLPVLSFHRLLGVSFTEFQSLQFCICGSVDESSALPHQSKIQC